MSEFYFATPGISNNWINKHLRGKLNLLRVTSLCLSKELKRLASHVLDSLSHIFYGQVCQQLNNIKEITLSSGIIPKNNRERSEIDF